MSKKILGLMCLLLLVSASTTNTSPAQTAAQDAWRLKAQGRKLSSQEAEDLELKLKGNPNDLSIRTMLLGYYSWKLEGPMIEARQKHILWIIQNHPESEIAGSPECEVFPSLNGDYYREAKKLWLQQIELHKNDPAVLGNAANFFLVQDRDLAERLFKQAEVIDPNNSEWPKQLGDLYSLGLDATFGKVRREAAAQSLEKYERALSLAQDEWDRADLLGNAAKTAFESGDMVKAKAYAGNLLNTYGQDKDGEFYDDAVSEGNQVLGRAALREGDITAAKTHLLDSAKISDDSAANSIIGPDMTLAKELLEKGQKTVVIEYLHLCAKFWKDEHGRLKDWEDDIRKGRVPDFDRNPLR